jgi:putative membrane protein
MKLILKWVLSAIALMALANIDAGIEVGGFGSALIAALVIGLFNLVVRPVLVVLTLPVTLVSLGLFLFVINAALFWAASAILEGFQVRNFSHALLGSLLYSVLGIVIDSALERLFPPRQL